MATPSNTERVERLNKASLRHVIEPDVDVVGELTQRQIVPDELLSVAGLDLELSAEQRARLAREEMASIFHAGVAFEATLIAGFAYQMALGADISDPRFTYALHEIGEETRHSRLFIRLVEQLAPGRPHPLLTGRRARRLGRLTLPMLVRRPATLDAFVLAGEEIPDLLQKRLAEHPGTDPYIVAVSRYHRAEEARHLAFARTTLGEHYSAATWTDRFAVRWVVPLAVIAMFDLLMVHPYVYDSVGLPACRPGAPGARSAGWSTASNCAASAPAPFSRPLSTQGCSRPAPFRTCGGGRRSAGVEWLLIGLGQLGGIEPRGETDEDPGIRLPAGRGGGRGEAEHGRRGGRAADRVAARVSADPPDVAARGGRSGRRPHRDRARPAGVRGQLQARRP